MKTKLESKNVVSYFIVILIAVILLIVLAIEVSNKTSNHDFEVENTASLNQTILEDDLVGTTLNVSDGSQGINSLSATRLNQTWLDFDGVNDNVTFNPITLSLINTTVYFEYRRNNVTNFEKLFGESSNPNLRYIGFSNIDDRLEVETNTNTDVIRGTVAIVDNNWHKYILVFNNYTGSFYQDNVLMGMTSPKANDNLTLDLIGQLGTHGFPNGSLHSLWIINNSLDTTEIDYVHRNDGDLNPSIYFERTGERYNMYPNPNGNVTGMTNGRVYTSNDNGTTFNFVANITNNTGVQGDIWMDSKNTTFTTVKDLFNLYMSMGNINNWTISLNVTNMSNGFCKYSTARPGSMSEDSLGNIYFGTYSGNLDNSYQNASCDLIYKSNDGGISWTNIYTGNNYLGGGVGDYRHVHFTQVDPYTDYIYASLGDSIGDRSFIRSIDYGSSWTVLKTEEQDGISWQPTAIAFTDGYRIIAEDWNIVGKPDGSGIYRTSDDENFYKVFETDDDEAGYFVFMKKDANGVIYTGTSEVNNESKVTLYASGDGLNWYELYQWDKNGYTDGTTTGFGMMSDFGVDGWAYIFDSKNTTVYPDNFRIKTRLFNITLQYKLNENQGTIAYDTSGNSNNGTISGATWNNDGVLITLTNLIDYSLAGNIFTILNDDLSWNQIITNYEDRWYTTFGFHLTIIKLTIGFICLGALSVVILYLLKILKEGKGE